MTPRPPLIQALLAPRMWDHPTWDIRLIETHISWIILTGPFAYKIKKPVDFGFLDFTTLEKRKYYCEQELHLNQRLAPQLYLAVVRFTGTPSHPRLDGTGPDVEFAVKMHQFDQNDLLSEYARRDRLRESHIVQLAELIAHFHEQTGRTGPESPYGEPKAIETVCLENFAHIDCDRLARHDLRETLEQLRDWTIRNYERLAAHLQARKREGYVRDCHGDLHLGNIVLWHGKPLPFDCIEFNPQLRWIDVISEIAFTVMDLAARAHRPLGFRFLNEYLSVTGDYAGLKLLRFYLVYRAMVRAKIAYLTFDQSGNSHHLHDLDHYLELARGFSQPRSRMLLITHGFSGSGKSFASRRLAAHLEAVHLRSDVERKRLAGLPPQHKSKAGLGKDLYSENFSRLTYDRLFELAKQVLEAEFSVIVDATFLHRKDRQRFGELAQSLAVDFRILDFKAEEKVLRQRIEKRLEAGKDPSEADLDVLRWQLEHHDPLSPQEQDQTLPLDTSQGFELEQALAKVASDKGSAR